MRHQRTVTKAEGQEKTNLLLFRQYYARGKYATAKCVILFCKREILI